MAPFIELEHIIHALQGFKRPLREGREALNNLVVVGIKARSATEAHIESLCVRTTKINEDPVEIKVLLDLKTNKIEEKIKDVSCSCPAGASKEHCCKHAMATLLYLERHDENDIEKLTCTDTKQKWGPAAHEATRNILNKFAPIPLKEFCHIASQSRPYRRKIKDLSSAVEAEIRSMFLADQPESEIAIFDSCVRHQEAEVDNVEVSLPLLAVVVSHALADTHYIIKRAAELGSSLYEQCTSEQKSYFDQKVRISYQDAMDIFMRTQEQSDCDEWDKQRFGTITGSICYSFHTYYKNKNPDWEKKIKSTYESRSNNITTQDMENGLLYEGDAKDSYEKKFNGKFKIAHPGFFKHPLTPWLGYSGDGVIFEDSKILRLWENKTPRCGKEHGAASICKHLAYMGKKEDGKLKEKDKYYGQIQLGMLLLSLPICDFTLYSMKFDEVYVDPVPFDEKFCLELTERSTIIYFKYILPWLSSREE